MEHSTCDRYGKCFHNCSSLDSPIYFQTFNVTNMSYMFAGCSVFNQDISVLNTSNVTNMSYMFSGCSMFDNNGSNNINELITGKLTNASYMSESCFKFNRYIEIEYV